MNAKRRDGWWYGFVLPTDLDQKAASTEAVAASWHDGSVRSKDHNRAEDGGAGWFPRSFVAPADQRRMYELQVTLSRRVDEANRVAREARVKLAAEAARMADEAKQKADVEVQKAQAEAQAKIREAEQAAAMVREKAKREEAAAVANAKAKEEEAAKALQAAKRAEEKRVEVEQTSKLEIERIRAEATNPIAIPPYWTTCGKVSHSNDGGECDGKRYQRTVVVREGSAEYHDVVRFSRRRIPPPPWSPPCSPSTDPSWPFQVSCFHRTAGDMCVIKLERVQNVALWQTYSMWLLQMRHRERERKQQGQSAVEWDQCEMHWLWHGTDEDAMRKMIANGFNRSYAGKNACLYGRGTYFAKAASYSASYSAQGTYAGSGSDGVMKLLACRVAVGASILGKNNQQFPGEEPAGSRNIKYWRDSKDALMFDTTIGTSPHEPDRWVTYNDAQAYPEYIVWCKK